jgi:predicted phosphoribosyltransferase
MSNSLEALGNSSGKEDSHVQSMKFASRQEAGRKLGLHFLSQGIRAEVVLGLPRGDVIVAAEVAKALACPLDIARR